MRTIMLIVPVISMVALLFGCTPYHAQGVSTELRWAASPASSSINKTRGGAV